MDAEERVIIDVEWSDLSGGENLELRVGGGLRYRYRNDAVSLTSRGSIGEIGGGVDPVIEAIENLRDGEKVDAEGGGVQRALGDGQGDDQGECRSKGEFH